MISQKLKKWAKIGLVLYALNKAFLPAISNIAFDSEHINDTQIQSYMNTEEYIHNYGCDAAQDEALKQLKLAHAVTMKYIALGDPSFGSSNEDFLESKIGDCSETSRFTYSNYLFLINKIGRPELSDYVRLANGSVNGFGHAWLEIKQYENWITYETTRKDIPDFTLINFSTIDELIPTEEVFDFERNYNRTGTHQINRYGNVCHDVDFIGSIKEPGFLLLAWRAIFGR